MKKQNKKAILLTFFGLLIYFISKAGKKMTSNKYKNFKINEAAKLMMLEEALINAGLSGDVLNYALSQLLFETGRFTKRSQVAVLNNNYSGIKFLNKSYQKAERGSLVPPGERFKDPNNPLNFYAKFQDADAWAKDFVRILNLGSKKPVNATSIEDYVIRLGNNRYFDITKTNAVKNYSNGLKSYFDMFI